MSSGDRKTEHIYLNAFNLIPQIGPVRFRKLLNYFPDLKTAWQGTFQEYFLCGIEESVARATIELREKIEPETEYEKLATHKVSLLFINDEGYPKQLKEIPNPPIGLYIKGKVSALSNKEAIAVVGSRKFSDYGKRVTEDLVRDLVLSNLTIVSGLALGIDAIAHQTALENEGNTVAVLACGLSHIYPANNRMLAEKILTNNGAIISELPLNTPPLKHHFPNRNRIISGLCLGTVVVEAAAESGALITAKHALEQNREVFGVPGSIYSLASAGPNQLIKMGAKLVYSVDDILEELNFNFHTKAENLELIVGDNEEERKILALLSSAPLHIDAVTKQSGLPSSMVAATLMMMEMKGKIKNLGGNQFTLRR